MEIAFEQLAERIERAVQHTEFTDVFRRRLDSSGIRALYAERVWDVFSLPNTDAIAVPHAELSELVSALMPLIERYVSPETGEVGNGLYHLTGALASPRLPSVEGYARILVLASTRIGPRRVTEMLAGWLEGQPITLWSCYLLKGAITDGELNPVDGLCIDTLSSSHGEFPRSLAAQIDEHNYRNAQFASRAIVSYELETEPALYIPGEGPSGFAAFATAPEIRNPELRSVSVEGLCRALSLEINGNVDWFRHWWEFGDVYAFFLSPGSSFNHKEIDGSTPLIVSEQQLAKSLDWNRQLNEFTKMDLGIARWRRSKQAATIEERLIELRIAMEAVLLTDDRNPMGEKTHRLALRGAWLLGGTFEERKQRFDSLRQAYGLASRVLHAGSLRSENETADLETISEAQDICRDAILRIIEDQDTPDWTSVVLGEGFHRLTEDPTG